MAAQAMNAEQTLEVAKTLVSVDRAEVYGDKLTNHQNIADLWSPYLGVKISPSQVAMMMALLKIARTKQGGGTHDNYTDAAAYTAISGELK